MKTKVQPHSHTLLSREDFKYWVFHRHHQLCALCPNKAEDAHHILDRKLFSDGGYYLANGIAVCADCHWQCETTQIPVMDLLLNIGVAEPILPHHFDATLSYDKWGNALREDGTRSPGPLMDDEGARKALAKGGFLGLIYAT